MIVALWNDLFTTTVRLLPMVFLLGAPLLLLLITLAAMVDAKIPHAGRPVRLAGG